MGEKNTHCPLCAHPSGSACFYVDHHRQFYRCQKCFLIYVPPIYFLSPEKEKDEYDKHQNSPDDLRYRQFLSHLYHPVQERLHPGSKGLDFGAGPGPTLSVMFEEAGHTMDIYDPFYAPDKEVLTKKYDFITASEVLEHCHNPAAELALLWSLLKPRGWLGIMTGMALDRSTFATWRYKDDLTHVCFFSRQTMVWLAEKNHVTFLFSGSSVCLMQNTMT